MRLALTAVKRLKKTKIPAKDQVEAIKPKTAGPKSKPVYPQIEIKAIAGTSGIFFCLPAAEVASGLILDMPIPIAKKLAVMTMRLSVATTPNSPSAIKRAPKKAKLNGPIKRKIRGASKRQVSMHTHTMQ